MGHAQKGVTFIEPEEYLRLQADSKDKLEYLDGVIYSWQGTHIRGMAGAPAEHNQVSVNLLLTLRQQLNNKSNGQGKECRVYNSDMRLRPHANSAYFYPDITVRCGPALSYQAMEISDACLIIEVLSPTTSGFDRMDKFARYQLMPTLESYVLVDPYRQTIEVFQRATDWQPHAAIAVKRCEPSERFELGTRGLTLLAADVFEGV